MFEEIANWSATEISAPQAVSEQIANLPIEQVVEEGVGVNNEFMFMSSVPAVSDLFWK